MYLRTISPLLTKQKRSFFLLGPRQTGKSTLLKSLHPDLTINLAHEQTFLDYAHSPGLLEERLQGEKSRRIFIDEIQRLPSLLNTIQFLLDETPGLQFYLSGSSARKLRRGRANLLPGRSLVYYLGPLSIFEVGKEFDLDHALSFGMLPGIFTEPDERQKKDLLRSYGSTYLREEIQAEGLLRQIEGFARFIFAAAARSGSLLDFSKLSSQAQAPRQSVVRYFEILEDTLLASRLEVYSQNISVRLTKQPRYFFFDVGVLNGILKNFIVSDDRKGSCFEHFYLQQLYHAIHSSGRDDPIYHYRTEGGAEVDFILDTGTDLVAIEVKATRNVGKHDIRHLLAFRDSQKKKRKVKLRLAYLGRDRRELDGVQILPWQESLLEVKGLC